MKIDNAKIRDVIRLLGEASNEVQMLRRRNEVLSAKVEVMDLFAQVLNTSPAMKTERASMDIAWELKDVEAKLKQEVVESEMPQPAAVAGDDF